MAVNSRPFVRFSLRALMLGGLAVGFVACEARTGALSEGTNLTCGETSCRTDADCPSHCGPCIEWSGTCALFQPR